MNRTLDVKFNVLRDNSYFSELIAVSPPALRMDNGGEIKLSMAGDFIDDPAIDWLKDEVQPILIIDGEETPLGVLLPATVRRAEDATTKSVHVEMYDRSWKVKDNLTETHIHLNAGTNYLDAVNQLLVESNITLVQPTPTTATLAEAREDWDVGTSRLTIINQLLSEINYNPLWFNAQGMAILEPATVPRAENIDHILDGAEVKSLIIPAITSEYKIIGKFVATIRRA